MPEKSHGPRIHAGCSMRSPRTGANAARLSSPRTTPRRRAKREDVAARLAAHGIDTQSPAAPTDALVLARSTDVTGLPGFAEGLFSVQDGAAQIAADLLDLRDGQRVLDACAAPGGKTAQILERADVQVLALDRDERRLP